MTDVRRRSARIVATGLLAVATCLAAVGAPGAAYADGATVAGMPTAIADDLGCDAHAWATWTFTGGTGQITIQGETLCNPYGVSYMSGQAHLYANGGSSPVVSTSVFLAEGTAFRRTDQATLTGVVAGQTWAVEYTTTIALYPGAPPAWTSVPPHCTGAGTDTITCTMIRFFAAS